MIRMSPGLSALVDDVAWHLEGFAQVVLDVLTVTMLALAIYASGVDGGPVVPPPSVAQASNICVVDCIIAMVLQRQDS